MAHVVSTHEGRGPFPWKGRLIVKQIPSPALLHREREPKI